MYGSSEDLSISIFQRCLIRQTKLLSIGFHHPIVSSDQMVEIFIIVQSCYILVMHALCARGHLRLHQMDVSGNCALNTWYRAWRNLGQLKYHHRQNLIEPKRNLSGMSVIQLQIRGTPRCRGTPELIMLMLGQ